MKIEYRFKTAILDAEEGVLLFHTKLPFYLFTKFFNRETELYNTLYHESFVADLCLSNGSIQGTDYLIEYDQSKFCNGTPIPHQTGMGNSEDILHDSLAMNKVIRNAYSVAKLSELLLEEYRKSEALQHSIHTLCEDASADPASILESQCVIGVYESMIHQALSFFQDKGDETKRSFYQSLLDDLDRFTKKAAPIITDQLMYLTSTAIPIGVTFRISNLLAYSILLKENLSCLELDKIPDVFEREFIAQFVRYIDSMSHK